MPDPFQHESGIDEAGDLQRDHVDGPTSFDVGPTDAMRRCAPEQRARIIAERVRIRLARERVGCDCLRVEAERPAKAVDHDPG